MTVRDLLPLALAVVTPVALVCAAVHLSRWYDGRRDPIESLITKPRPCAGMEQVDWSKAERAGEVRWQETLRAQRRTRTRDIQPRILPMSGARRRP